MPKIGLEIHGYLNTKEKLFCACKAEHGLKHFKPNTSICPICTGQPGAKPMLPNKASVNKIIQISLVLGCKINQKVVWQRKHYSWPDLPKGYQNTISGAYAIPNAQDGKFLGIKIRECHLEEDPAAWNPKTGQIDYNRSGSPLIEIVTEPEFNSSEQITDWLKQLKANLSYIKAIDKSAGLKADVNISLPEKNGVRIEIKNVNSIKNIQKAVEYEIQRQSRDVPKIQETRRFDELKGITARMRTKEQAEDYRFISDPDLPIITIDKKRIDQIKSQLPESPQEKLGKLIKKYKIDKKHAEILTKKIDIAEFFEKVAEKSDKNLAVRWVTEELLNILNYNKKELDDPDVDINSEHFIELLNLLEKGKITELKAKEILRKFIPKSFSPKEAAEKSIKISDKADILKFVKQAIKENPKAVQDYKQGKKEALNFLVGYIMKISKKRADYKMAKELLEKELR
ncbi:MAG TPA: Asp-tRNA(Asn)/Glu-tRNA(Gln) amidotransferase subunit GatB [Candidatus Nanoarchaeia archaeon]|nr:Asp-tRNA(Asn)/Glu-tRNA(Gln) amidotransferase subunit GatB [Candidatus Nanoarchaeia archaeon]